ncbi:hypothetical protein H2203_000458 [Taxawa tesnikishii (nom. ined.)]|nr:hypothetical protein H2203_000458 [Dothideales sp. JES 119]
MSSSSSASGKSAKDEEPSSPQESQPQPRPQPQPQEPKPREHDVEKNAPDGEKKQEKERDPFLVQWEPGEKANPKNWSTGYKSWITFQLGMLALSASLGSSIISPAEEAISQYTHISTEVAVLSISLYILGFAFGPLVWAPVSEIWGERSNAQSIFITRFFGGVFGSAPVSNVSAALGDMWQPKARGTAVTFYAVAVVGGPTLGPLIGAALTVNKHLGWRWTEYIEAIWVFAVFFLGLFCFPEVYAPYLLKKKAQRLRKETGDSRYYHPHENTKLDVKTIVTKHFSRPIRMLLTEPMVTCIALYASFVYSLLYMTLEVFPIVYQQHRHFGLVVSTLPFLALFVGVLFAVLINLANQSRYARISSAAGGKPVPEARLPPMAVGGFLFSTGLWWFGWTADPSIHWAVPTVAAGFIGAGFNTIFQQCINFLVDTYKLYAASAVSANTFLRSLLAAGLPLAARPMFNNLGVGPAMSILASVATLALPIPFIFMKYGLKLRKMSKFAPVDE